MTISAVHRGLEIALTDSEELVRIERFLDEDGDECAPKDAVVAIAGPDREGLWYSIDLREFEPAQVT
jgi:hypothetical protein